MFNHTDIWQAIDELAKANNLSASGLAKQAGLDPTTFNKSKRTTEAGKFRWPSTESIAKILSVTNTPLSKFMEYLSGEAMQDHWLAIPHIDEDKASQHNVYKKNGTLNTDIMERIDAPFSRQKNVICFEITSGRFEPMYQSGDHLIIDIHAEHRKGDTLFLKMRNKSFAVGSLIKETITQLRLECADAKIDIDRNNIDWMGRVLWISQ